MRELERRVVLSVLDRKWREHLYEMDYLQEGIGLRAMAQRDPLVEYQREGFDLFAAMMDGIKEESVGYLFNLEVQVEDDADGREADGAEAAATPPDVVAKGLDAPRRPARAAVHRADRRRRPETPRPGDRRCATGGRQRVRRRPAQRAVPLRLGQEVQALPR